MKIIVISFILLISFGINAQHFFIPYSKLKVLDKKRRAFDNVNKFIYEVRCHNLLQLSKFSKIIEREKIEGDVLQLGGEFYSKKNVKNSIRLMKILNDIKSKDIEYIKRDLNRYLNKQSILNNRNILIVDLGNITIYPLSLHSYPLNIELTIAERENTIIAYAIDITSNSAIESISSFTYRKNGNPFDFGDLRFLYHIIEYIDDKYDLILNSHFVHIWTMEGITKEQQRQMFAFIPIDYK